jgi:hypothetical protein
MRGRIRTVKPEAFLDEELWDLEVATGLPIFHAFVGLFTQADREGRFEWRPRALKAAILPYWEGDFSRVLDALSTRAFVGKYTVEGRDFGVVRTFLDHQSINNREEASQLPEPPADLFDSKAKPPPSTCPPRVPDASPRVEHAGQVERKGTEGNGREGNGGDARARDPVGPTPAGIVEAAYVKALGAAPGGGAYRQRTGDHRHFADAAECIRAGAPEGQVLRDAAAEWCVAYVTERTKSRSPEYLAEWCQKRLAVGAPARAGGYAPPSTNHDAVDDMSAEIAAYASAEDLAAFDRRTNARR